MTIRNYFSAYLKGKFSRATLFVLPLFLLSFGANAEQIFLTTLELKEPTTAAGIDRIEFVWSTDAERKHAGGKELADLQVAMFAGNSLVYTDLAISKWLLKPVLSEKSLLERKPEDIFWDYDVGNMTLRQFRSILPKSLKQSSGEHYQAADGLTLQHDGQVHIRHFIDGEVVEAKVGYLLRQSTRLLKSFEPAAENGAEVKAEEVETVTLDPSVAGETADPDSDTGGNAQFIANAYGLYVAELAAFGLEENPENIGVRVEGELRPVLVADGVLHFFLGEEDVEGDVEIGRWAETLTMEIVDANPVSADGDVGFATPGEGENVLDLAVGEDISRYIVTGIKGDEVWLLDVSDPARPRWLTQESVLESPEGLGVYFETGVTQINRVLLLPPEQALKLQPGE